MDNRPANLELWSTAHPKGQRIVDKVRFALEMLRRYAPDLLDPSELARLRPAHTSQPEGPGPKSGAN